MLLGLIGRRGSNSETVLLVAVQKGRNLFPCHHSGIYDFHFRKISEKIKLLMLYFQGTTALANSIVMRMTLSGIHDFMEFESGFPIKSLQE
jgi:hypothetical protein